MRSFTVFQKSINVHALILWCEIPSSKIEVKMERTNFYETLYKKALECANSENLIQQTA